MAADDDDYVYDEATGEWRPASEMAAAAAQAAEVRDAAGNVLVDGDSVTLIKDLKVKGANQTLKQGTVIRRSEEHTSELQSLMRHSYAVFCLKKKKCNTNTHKDNNTLNNVYKNIRH